MAEKEQVLQEQSAVKDKLIGASNLTSQVWRCPSRIACHRACTYNSGSNCSRQLVPCTIMK